MSKAKKATNYITLGRTDAQGRYAEIIDVCDALSEKYGSPTNALAQLASRSLEFVETSRSLRRRRAPKA